MTRSVYEREIISPRCFALFGALLIALLLAIAYGAHSEDAPVIRPGAGALIACETTLPTETALTAVGVVDFKGDLLTLWATMPDGRLLCFDKHTTKATLGELVAWGIRAKHSAASIAPLSVGGTLPESPDTTT